jgi:hypothetical protein
VAVMIFGLVWNVRANIRHAGFNLARFAFLGALQISMLCLEAWLLARTKA